MEWSSFLFLLIAGTVWLWLAVQMLTAKRKIVHNRTTHIDLGVSMGDIAGCTSIQGSRPHMEDTYQVVRDLTGDGKVKYFAVFDGHGGPKASKFAAERLHLILAKHKDLLSDPHKALTESLEELDARWLEKANLGQRDWSGSLVGGYDDGSTAVVVIVIGGMVYCANTGDSRCVMGVSNTSPGESCVEMSEDHKPNRSDERKRIEAAGGRVHFIGTWRVEGILAVSRAIGDRRLKKWVIATPDIKSKRVSAQDDAFLILASDGLWDVLSSSDAVRFVQKIRNDNPKDFVVKAANELTIHSFTKGSLDNITTLIVDLNKCF